ncbi:MAG: hypothetical protein BAA01_10270 [Bacillus thermozeamaize]|uniref:inositol-phosphate phosphatase n=1 Tax=Bacillus thermozeamaize TaxID=230954 RepID=A0A1Y3PNN9_9BACI|nr:MAG: hypothetical protein BAA01_10270 [Bacillus thermozeamaize]
MNNDLLDLAKCAAIKAGEFLKSRKSIVVEDTNQRDIKLSSDKRSEQIIIEELEKTGIPILSEETGLLGNEEHEFKWIIDPLDGTANYYKNMPDLACVSIALWDRTGPILGVVNRFAVSEMYYGVVGQGSFMNGEKIRPSDIKRTRDAIMATGFPVFRDYSTDSLLTYIKKVQHFKKTRMIGAAALMSTFVACGKIDAYFEEEIMIWDIAAGTAIVKASGGIAEIEMLNGNKCICRCFANKELREDYYAKGI